MHTRQLIGHLLGLKKPWNIFLKPRQHVGMSVMLFVEHVPEQILKKSQYEWGHKKYKVHFPHSTTTHRFFSAGVLTLTPQCWFLRRCPRATKEWRWDRWDAWSLLRFLENLERKPYLTRPLMSRAQRSRGMCLHTLLTSNSLSLTTAQCLLWHHCWHRTRWKESLAALKAAGESK